MDDSGFNALYPRRDMISTPEIAKNLGTDIEITSVVSGSLLLNVSHFVASFYNDLQANTRLLRTVVMLHHSFFKQPVYIELTNVHEEI